MHLLRKLLLLRIIAFNYRHSNNWGVEFYINIFRQRTVWISKPNRSMKVEVQFIRPFSLILTFLGVFYLFKSYFGFLLLFFRGGVNRWDVFCFNSYNVMFLHLCVYIDFVVFPFANFNKWRKSLYLHFPWYSFIFVWPIFCNVNFYHYSCLLIHIAKNTIYIYIGWQFIYIE